MLYMNAEQIIAHAKKLRQLADALDPQPYGDSLRADPKLVEDFRQYIHDCGPKTVVLALVDALITSQR